MSLLVMYNIYRFDKVVNFHLGRVAILDEIYRAFFLCMKNVIIMLQLFKNSFYVQSLQHLRLKRVQEKMSLVEQAAHLEIIL